MAFPGVAIHTTLVAVIYKYVFPYDWTWNQAFLFGSIISATDPVAVVRPPLPPSFAHVSSFCGPVRLSEGRWFVGTELVAVVCHPCSCCFFYLHPKK